MRRTPGILQMPQNAQARYFAGATECTPQAFYRCHRMHTRGILLMPQNAHPRHFADATECTSQVFCRCHRMHTPGILQMPQNAHPRHFADATECTPQACQCQCLSQAGGSSPASCMHVCVSYARSRACHQQQGCCGVRTRHAASRQSAAEWTRCGVVLCVRWPQKLLKLLLVIMSSPRITVFPFGKLADVKVHGSHQMGTALRGPRQPQPCELVAQLAQKLTGNVQLP